MGKDTSIGKKVRLAFEAFMATDYEEAFLQASLAVAATAKRERPTGKRDNEVYKAFLKDNMNIITGLMGMCVASVRMPCQNPDVAKYASNSGSVGLDDILYNLVRCKLVHNSIWPPGVEVTTDGTIGGGGPGKNTLLPHTTILGLLVAVISSGVNGQERMVKNFAINIGTITLKTNEIWGLRPTVNATILDWYSKKASNRAR